MKRLLAAATAIVLTAGAGSAFAAHRDGDRYYDERHYDSRYEGGRYDEYGAQYDWAQVVDVAPIISQGRQPVHREQCWEQPVHQRVVYDDYRHQRPRNSAAPVLGAIIGGVVGNQFGSGSGRVAMTAAGAALGHAIARDGQRYEDYRYRNERYGYDRYGHDRYGYDRHGYGHDRVVYAQRCRTVTDYVRDERVMGYNVTYVFAGQTYQTRTDYHPGDRIRVRVDVTAIP